MIGNSSISEEFFNKIRVLLLIVAITFIVFFLSSSISLFSWLFTSAGYLSSNVIQSLILGSFSLFLLLFIKTKINLITTKQSIKIALPFVLLLPVANVLSYLIHGQSAIASHPLFTGNSDIEYLLLLSILMVSIMIPAEELLFRGIIQSRLSFNFSAPSAIFISSVLFGLFHIGVYGGLGNLLGVGIIGLTLGCSYYLSDNNLIVAIVAHTLNNISILVLGIL